MSHPVDQPELRNAALGGIYAKLRRADAHLKLLNDTWGKYLRTEPYPYSFVIDIKPETGDHLVYAKVIDPPPILSAIVGDILHNLRSALDHLAWELVKLAGAKPGHHTSFPICDTEDRWLREVVNLRREKDRRSPLTGIEPGSDIWKFIEAVQPCKRAKYADAMSALRVLSNADKHRQLLVSGMFPHPDDFAANIRYSPEAVLREQKILLKPDQPMKHGDKIAALNFDPGKPDPELEIEGKLAIDIAFSDGAWDTDRIATADLKMTLFQYVEYAGALWADPPYFEDPAQLTELDAGSAFTG